VLTLVVVQRPPVARAVSNSRPWRDGASAIASCGATRDLSPAAVVADVTVYCAHGRRLDADQMRLLFSSRWSVDCNRAVVNASRCGAR